MIEVKIELKFFTLIIYHIKFQLISSLTDKNNQSNH